MVWTESRFGQNGAGFNVVVVAYKEECTLIRVFWAQVFRQLDNCSKTYAKLTNLTAQHIVT